MSTVVTQSYLSLLARHPDFSGRKQLLESFELERVYREKEGISDFGKSRRAGRAYRRLASQRKYSESVLHLENRSCAYGVLVHQMAYSLWLVGHGDCYSDCVLVPEKIWQPDHEFYGVYVLGYMLKDRVKALGTSFTDRRLGRILADYYGGSLQ